MTGQTSINLTVLGPGSQTSGKTSDMEGLADELRSAIKGEVRFGRHDRMLYSTDASLYQIEPLGVICPVTNADVEATVGACARRGIAILPRGGGTSLAGQTVNRAVVIDFSAYCRELIEVRPDERWARVQPGIVLDQLNASLAVHGLMFGPDVATSAHANLGGMIGNNSAGAHSILYGRTVEHLLELEVLLADGRRLNLSQGASERDPVVAALTHQVANLLRPREAVIEQRFPRTVRHVNGYNLDLIVRQLRESTPGTFDRVNLAHLVCGSEGTLAITLEAKLNLVPRPKHTGLAIVSYADVDQAMTALLPILGTSPAAVELIDDVVIGLALENREYRQYVKLLPPPPGGSPGAVLYVAYFADDAEQLTAKFEALRALFPSQAVACHTEPAAMLKAWKLRKAGEPLLHGLPGSRKPLTFIEDTAVNPDQLAAFVRDFRGLVARHGTRAAYYAHASVGCLHIRPLIDIRSDPDRMAMQQLIEEATDLVMRYGGALSGEHGDGRVRSHLLERFYGPEICEMFRAIKTIFDPRNLLNPGNIVAPGPMLENLRVKPHNAFLPTPSGRTWFRYEREHGFGEAVEMCNGAGVCRRMKGGTMCPSYRATLDERHATRGRGNALRLAITGQFSSDGAAAWNDAETLATLDLCLSCKACKSECPSNVDIAKLKAEYLAQGFERGRRVPLSSRFFGNIRTINLIGSLAPGLANALGRFGPVKRIADRLIGLHSARSIPTFAPSLERWMRRRPPPSLAADAPTVLLFPDCFTVFNEPRIGRAAVLSLERLGYRVVLPKIGCCGRAAISNGLLGKAAATVRRTSADLLKSVEKERAIAIVGCEPSCVSSIKDEWLELELGVSVEPLRNLASQTHLVESFIEMAWDRHPRRPESPRPDSRNVLLHGHCHQKALFGVESSAAPLRRVFGDRLKVLDSGCCGMAGSFGYGATHYDVSMKIGEQSLFGQLRQRPEAVVAAPGTSCRQQIHDGLQGRMAVHPVELIAEALGLTVP